MNFTAIIGHQRQKAQLQQAWSSHRLAHAYMFIGPDGVGKKLMALALVKLIFCVNQNGCGECAACQKLDHHNHPDLHLIEADGTQIKIDQIRDLQKELHHPPLDAPRRICIIDNADKLNPAASNALLKTLEEPRAEVMLILVSSQPHLLLDTIRSRCQQLIFSRLSRKMVREILIEHNIATNHIDIIASLSEGSLKKALGNDREFYAEQRQKICKAISILTPNSIIPLFKLAEELANDKEQLDNLIWILLSYYRDIFLLVNRASPSLLINHDLEPQLRQQAQRESTVSIQYKLGAIIACQQQLVRNVNKQLAIEVLLLKLTGSLQR